MADARAGTSQIRVNVHAIDVNYSDLLVIGGKYQVLPKRPFVPGKGAAGVVSALGESVCHCRIGDRVLVAVEHGAYAEHVLADGEHSYVIPEAMSFTEAAALGLVYQTAHFALVDRGGFRPGDTVLVTGGGGGVGLAAIPLVKALGGTALAGTRSLDEISAPNCTTTAVRLGFPAAHRVGQPQDYGQGSAWEAIISLGRVTTPSVSRRLDPGKSRWSLSPSTSTSHP